MGGNVAKIAKEDLENKLDESVISKENSLDYKYTDKPKKLKINKAPHGNGMFNK